jgi:hypothetical protein
MQESSTEHPFDRSAVWTLAAALRNSSCIKATLPVFFYLVSMQEVHKVFVGYLMTSLPQRGHYECRTLLRVIEQRKGNLKISSKTRHGTFDGRLQVWASRRGNFSTLRELPLMNLFVCLIEIHIFAVEFLAN